MSRPVKVPDASHPITVGPTPGRVRVLLGQRVIADSTAALTLQESTYPPVQYIPIIDIDPATLSASELTTWCPFKGEASYYSLLGDDGVLADSVWTYREPQPAVGLIAGHAAFYPDRVTIEIS